jgi:hypothetical protein
MHVDAVGREPRVWLLPCPEHRLGVRGPGDIANPATFSPAYVSLACKDVRKRPEGIAHTDRRHSPGGRGWRSCRLLQTYGRTSWHSHASKALVRRRLAHPPAARMFSGEIGLAAAAS